MFRFLSRPADTVFVQGKRVYLRLPEMTDFESWQRLRLESRSFLEPWEPAWGADDLTRASYRMRLRRYEHDYAGGLSVPLFVFLQNGHTLVGGLTLGYIRRGAAQSSMIGYWMGAAHAGKGLMHDALETVVPYAFDVLRLHRIEAACIPDNARSIGLLEKAGFQREGRLRGYLKINGVWRDHVLYARIAEKRGAGASTAERPMAVQDNSKTVA